MRREHRRDHSERDHKTPRRTGEQAGAEEDHEREARAVVVDLGVGLDVSAWGTIRPPRLGSRKRGQSLGAAHRMCCGTVPIFAGRVPRVRTLIFQSNVLPGRAHMGSGRVIAELAGPDRRGEVAGKERDSERYPTTELPSSRGYIEIVLGLHSHERLLCMRRASNGHGAQATTNQSDTPTLASSRDRSLCHLWQW